jgi:hypothetical protein
MTTTADVYPYQPDPIERLSRDVRVAALQMSEAEARWLVDAYYTIQGYRLDAQNNVRALKASEEPNQFVTWLFDQQTSLEGSIQKILDDFSLRTTAGQWVRSLPGFGPVITAGLLAHIDIHHAPTAGHIWAYAGLDPTRKWGKGQKRPWNARLKVLCWKIGESLVKVSNGPCFPAKLRAADAEGTDGYERADKGGSTATPERAATAESTATAERADSHEGTELGERAAISESTASYERVLFPDLPECEPGCMNYGHTYRRRKQRENRRNLDGVFADQAQGSLDEKKFDRATDAFRWYSGCYTRDAAVRVLAAGTSQAREALAKKHAGEPGSGVQMLPPARIHLRSERYAAKLFLAHLHHVLHESVLGTPPPLPFVIASPDHPEHVHHVGPPNWPMR